MLCMFTSTDAQNGRIVIAFSLPRAQVLSVGLLCGYARILSKQYKCLEHARSRFVQ
jgi:hypothetical protein